MPGFSRWAAAVLTWAAPLLAAAAVPPAPETLRLDLDRLDLRALYHKDLSPDQEEEFPVAILQDAEPRRLTGTIEVKGSFTRRLLKRSFLIKLAPGSNWQGHQRILVDARGTDGTLMRDWLAWDIWRQLGMATPDVRYLRLVMNRKKKGLYLQVAWIGPDVFARSGLGADGELYQPPDRHHCGNLTALSAQDIARCYQKLSPRDENMGALQQLIAAIGAAPVASFDRFVDRTFDAESVINWYALNVIISNLDTDEKNYFLYRSSQTGKWHFVPFDFDLSQGRTYDPHLEYPRTILNTGFTYWNGLEYGLPNVLRQKVLQNPVLRGRLLRRIAELVEGGTTQPWSGYASFPALRERIAMLRERVLPVVREDPYMNPDAFEEDVGALVHYYRSREAFLRKMVLRDDALRLRDEVHGVALPPGQEAEVIDEGGYHLATVVNRGAAAQLDMYVQRGVLAEAPAGISPTACVQRWWSLRVTAATTADLTLEFIHENAMKSEIGPTLTDERRLRLFVRDDAAAAWRALPTTVNAAANLVAAPGVALPQGRDVRLMACAP